MNIFDIIGPVMIGPSSSHTAGAVRIGRIASLLMHEPVKKAEIKLFGSFAKTYIGHGTDKALVGGILGMEPNDERIRESLEIARNKEIEIEFSKATGSSKHPNTVEIILYGSEQKIMIRGASVGGGNILISQIDGMNVEITGQNDTLIVVHHDIPGVVGKVAEFLGNCGINVCNMALSREQKGGKAILCVAVDGHMDVDVTSMLNRFTGVERCIIVYANK